MPGRFTLSLSSTFSMNLFFFLLFFAFNAFTPLDVRKKKKNLFQLFYVCISSSSYTLSLCLPFACSLSLASTQTHTHTLRLLYLVAFLSRFNKNRIHEPRRKGIVITNSVFRDPFHLWRCCVCFSSVVRMLFIINLYSIK